MNKLTIYTYLIASIAIASCAKKSEEQIKDPQAKEESIKPIDIKFDENYSFQSTHEFKNISKDGSIQFRLPNFKTYDFYIDTIKASTTGCSSQNISYNTYFIPNEDKEPTSGYEIFQKKTIVEVSKNQTSSLYVNFKNISGCESLKLNILIYQKPNINSIVGNWISNVTLATDPFHKLTIEVSKYFQNISDLPVANFAISCGSYSLEKFSTTIISTDNQLLPYTLILQINQINSISSSLCSKQFGLSYNDVNKNIYCIHNKEQNQPNFNLACQLENSNKTFPVQYNDISTSWSHQ